VGLAKRERNERNGFSYVRARYYFARRGRFLTKDPFAGRDDDGQSLNRYVYALNNPVRRIDVSGLSVRDAVGVTSLFGPTDKSRIHRSAAAHSRAFDRKHYSSLFGVRGRTFHAS
jgi:RHS repeat-associated protein